MVGIPSWVGLQARGDIGESGNLLDGRVGGEIAEAKPRPIASEASPSGGER